MRQVKSLPPTLYLFTFENKLRVGRFVGGLSEIPTN